MVSWSPSGAKSSPLLNESAGSSLGCGSRVGVRNRGCSSWLSTNKGGADPSQSTTLHWPQSLWTGLNEASLSAPPFRLDYQRPGLARLRSLAGLLRRELSGRLRFHLGSEPHQLPSSICLQLRHTLLSEAPSPAGAAGKPQGGGSKVERGQSAAAGSVLTPGHAVTGRRLTF